MFITDAVYYETVVEGVAHEEALDIARADFLKNVSPKNQKLVKFLLELVDYGEAETIAFAIENDVDLVVLDDKEARKVARGFGLIKEVGPYVERLKKHGFRISDGIVQKILENAGELKS